MSEQKAQPEEQEQQEPESQIVIDFAHPGSAEPQAVKCYAVSPGQLHAASRRLQLMGDRLIQQQMARAEMAQAQKATQLAGVRQALKGKPS